MSFIFARTHNYALLFEIGSGAMVIAFATNLLASRFQRIGQEFHEFAGRHNSHH
jgi:hypothetical protein